MPGFHVKNGVMIIGNKPKSGEEKSPVKSQISKEQLAKIKLAENALLKSQMSHVAVRVLIFLVLIPFKMIGFFIEYIVLGGSAEPANHRSNNNPYGDNYKANNAMGEYRNQPYQHHDDD